MTVAAVRTAIVARLNSVQDIGRVHAYERYAADLAKLKQLYWSPDFRAIRGWFVRRPNTAETDNVQGRTVEQIRWQIRGFMSFDDLHASELVFRRLA